MNKKYKILIVEDNPDLNEMFQLAFDAEKFELTTVFNGIDGVTKAVEVKPDLILLDVMMPQMDGYEVITALRQNSSLKPIIVVNSNLEQKKDADRAIQLGADFYLRKSEYSPSELVKKVEEILGNAESVSRA